MEVGVVAGLIGAGSVLTLLGTWIAQWRRSAKTRVRARPLIKIADASDGDIVRIQGNVGTPDAPLLHAPITNRACAGWQLFIQRQTPGGSWATFHQREDCIPFSITDESGTASISKGEVELHLVSDRRGTSSDGRKEIRRVNHGKVTLGVGGANVLIGPNSYLPADEHLLSYIAEHCRDAFNKFNAYTSYNYRFHEGVIEVGEAVAVVGLAHRVLDPSTAKGYREAGTSLTVSAPAEGKVLISDHPELIE